MNKVEKDVFYILCNDIIQNKLPDDVCYIIYDYLFNDEMITNNNVYIAYETYRYEKYYEEEYNNKYFKNKFFKIKTNELMKSIIICLIHKKIINLCAIIPYLKNDINYFKNNDSFNHIYNNFKFNNKLLYIQLYIVIKEFIINNNVKSGTCLYNINYMNKIDRINDKINNLMKMCKL